ncbi:DUF2339 domain-containing protein [Paenibacillus sp. DYY-L-2]|uniref:DUF2339 domain-containing protein n=1 Tax=Paenibacillus sp. DYY-L-2 TaxID=3447013 RepID=UPI003F50BC39
MKDFRERLAGLRETQEQLAREYETLLQEYDADGILRENETLRQEHAQLRQRANELEARLRGLEAENARLQQAFPGQESSTVDKPDPFSASQGKMNTYLSGVSSGFESRLATLEARVKQRIQQLYEQAEGLLGQDREVIASKLGQFQDEINHRMADHRRYVSEGERRIREEAKRGYEQLAGPGAGGPGAAGPNMSPQNMAVPNMTQPGMVPPGMVPPNMTPPNMTPPPNMAYPNAIPQHGWAQGTSGHGRNPDAERESKQNWLEMKIGLNWINKLGVLLIILAVGAAFQYSYLTWFNGYMKGASFFLLGLLMLAGGEWQFRKNRQVFALGLLGGGISVLYGSVFYSYFLLEIISLFVGLFLSILITVAAVLLSLRYESRTICSFGLVGGYLPFFSYMAAFSLEGSAVYVAMGYLFLLNALILLVSLRKRWPVVNYISFVFNISSMLALVFIAESEAAGMAYTVITFLTYLGITLYVPFKYKSKLTWWDFSLLALNTVVNCATLYSLLEKAGWDGLRGLLALVFCLSYLGLARMSKKVLEEEKETRLLFYGTSLTFSMLIVPFQFGIHYLSMAWLFEGLVLSVLGHLYRYKKLERIGWGIVGLTLGAFLLIDSFISLFNTDSFDFSWKYTFISLGLAALALFYSYRLQEEGDARRYTPMDRSLLSAIKYVGIVNIGIYLLYETGRLYERFMPEDASLFEFYRALLMSAVALLTAFAISKIPFIQDAVVKVYNRILYGFGYLMSIAVTLTIPSLNPNGMHNSAENYVALVILIAFNLMVFFSGRDLLYNLLDRSSKSREVYPVIVGVYIFSIITAFLGVQFRLGHVGWLFSLVYLLLAIGYIVYGFRHNYLMIRRIGLGLSLLSTGKMLLFDLNLMTTGSKIIAFFSFGVVLLGISFIYQRVSNKMSPVQEKEQTDMEG